MADAPTAEAVQLAPLGRGFVVGMCGREHNVLKINPPPCVTADDADQLLQATEESLAVVLASA